MQVLARGKAPFLPVDPDGFRAYVRDHERRALTPRLMSARDAVERFVAEATTSSTPRLFPARALDAAARGDPAGYGRDLWIAAVRLVDVGLFAGAGCASKADCGFFWRRRH